MTCAMLSSWRRLHPHMQRPWAGPIGLVNNHGVLTPEQVQTLMQRVFVFPGFAAVMMGPAAIEAISNGLLFLNYAFVPARNLNVLQQKPTTQLWTSQFPFLEDQQPHALTINTNDPADVATKLGQVQELYNRWWVKGEYARVQLDAMLRGHVFLGKTRGHRSGHVPYEYTTVAVLLRVQGLMHNLAQMHS